MSTMIYDFSSAYANEFCLDRLNNRLFFPRWFCFSSYIHLSVFTVNQGITLKIYAADRLTKLSVFFILLLAIYMSPTALRSLIQFYYK